MKQHKKILEDLKTIHEGSEVVIVSTGKTIKKKGVKYLKLLEDKITYKITVISYSHDKAEGDIILKNLKRMRKIHYSIQPRVKIPKGKPLPKLKLRRKGKITDSPFDDVFNILDKGISGKRKDLKSDKIIN